MRKFKTDWRVAILIYTVSQKNMPDIFSRNSRKHCRIFIIFGTCVTENVSNQYDDDDDDNDIYTAHFSKRLKCA